MRSELVKPADGDSGPLSRQRLDLDLNGAVLHAHGITANLDPGTVGPSPVGQPKTPRVPRTGYDPVVHVTGAQRSPHVRTNVIDGKVLALVVKNGNEFAGHLDHFPVCVTKILNPANCLKLGHEGPFPASLSGPQMR